MWCACPASRTARATLRALSEHGIVEIRPGRRALLLKAGYGLADVQLDGRVAVEEGLRVAMLRDRLSGALALEQTQADLVRRYGVGLPTLRRVLERTRQEGWSDGPDDSGRSRKPTLQDGAIRSPERTFGLDAALHATLATWGGNPFLSGVIRQQNALRAALEMNSYDAMARVAAWCAEHIRTMQAISRNAMSQARRLMTKHLGASAAVLAGSRSASHSARLGRLGADCRRDPCRSDAEN